MLKRLNIHLVTWNGEKYIPFLFESLKKQSFKDWELCVLDNASEDKTLDILKIEIKDLGVPVKIIENSKNIGFAGGHNQIFTIYDLRFTNYILLLNQDMYLEQDCLEKMISFMDKNKDVAVTAPRLMKWNFKDNKFTNQIDSLGLKVHRNRRVVDWFNGEDWKNSTNKRIIQLTNQPYVQVFGVSGALPMYRSSIIDKEDYFFDESFGSYKEDVDLAFRLQSAGFKSSVILDAVSYHNRSAAGPKHSSYMDTVRRKKTQSLNVSKNSYKNHLVTLLKNEYWQNFFLDLHWILWYEIKKFTWYLFFDREVLKGLVEIWSTRGKIGKKRIKAKTRRKLNWMQIRKWWIHDS
jgi:GT2 family glycosyltransferase